jgi:DNA-binding phage protein
MLHRMDIQTIAKGLRALTNMTEFAKRSKVSRATLYRVRNGWANPTLDTLRRIEAQLAKQEKP